MGSTRFRLEPIHFRILHFLYHFFRTPAAQVLHSLRQAPDLRGVPEIRFTVEAPDFSRRHPGRLLAMGIL